MKTKVKTTMNYRTNRWMLVIALIIQTVALAQRGPGPGGLASLKTAVLPAPTGLATYVQDNTALVTLGKALFWEMQAGSDGRTACASCHFHAGADHRQQNQLSGAAAAPNLILKSSDFPFHQLSDPNNNRSNVVSDKRQVAASAGLVHRQFLGLDPAGSTYENSATLSTPTFFLIGGISTRQATTRNTPSVVNAVFNFRNFWDGRASNVFTGATPFGDSDTALNAYVYQDQMLSPVAVRMLNSSLASQAAGPALNDVEMSFAGRTWQDLGRKLLPLTPLARQTVASDDSVLGSISNGLGLQTTYASLVQNAFQSSYWSAPDPINGYSQIEQNFGLFWALAIQAYETTLISDNTRFDQFQEGNRQALTTLEVQGLQVFQGGNSQCTTCHTGPEMTLSAFTSVLRPNTQVNDPQDFGFIRTGVTPLADDAGLNANDAFGQPLFPAARAGQTSGAFKTPGLRNVELTGPYFHDGGQATLEQVVDFYGRNADFPGGNLGPGIGRIRLSAQDKTALVAFLKSLTDDRVKYERAPFDHPSLCVSAGQVEMAPGILQVDSSQPGLSAADKWTLIPASGKGGLSAPLQTWDELLRGIGNDGSRSHTLADSCVP